jgi:hypothetical protein
VGDCVRVVVERVLHFPEFDYPGLHTNYENMITIPKTYLLASTLPENWVRCVTRVNGGVGIMFLKVKYVELRG